MIRKVEVSDLHRVSTLIGNTLLLTASGDYTIEQIKSLTATYSEVALEAMAGRARIRVHASSERIDGMVCLQGDTIQALFVAPDRQRTGIGTTLIRWAEFTARQEGCAHLRVAASLTAVGFYHKMGFETQTRGRTNGNVRIVHMIKPL